MSFPKMIRHNETMMEILFFQYEPIDYETHESGRVEQVPDQRYVSKRWPLTC